MRKYVVRVQYKNKGDLVWTLKAKSDEDLERVINDDYQDCLDLIDGYEYEELKRFMFKKNDSFPICGNWVGADCLKYGLDKKRSQK